MTQQLADSNEPAIKTIGTPHLPLLCPFCAPYAPLRAITCPYAPLHALTRHYVPLCAITRHDVPLHTPWRLLVG